MDIINSQEKACTNCRYYSQHYSKQGTRFDTVHCGHCLHNKYKRRPTEVCEYWENIAIKKEARKKSIKQTIQSMSKKLNEIAVLLKDDNEREN